MTDRPPYLLPLSRPDVTLEIAYENGVSVFEDNPIPAGLCHQCFDTHQQAKIIEAAQQVKAKKAPDAINYYQIFFEHPNCSGGIETVKLFMPFALHDFMTGLGPSGETEYSYCGVLETLVQSGFWFWTDPQQAAIRDIALCLFWDWFEKGQHDWPHPDYLDDDALGPGDDILTLMTLCLIDPLEITEALSKLHTLQADAALAGPLNFSISPCTYVALDTHMDNSNHHDATCAISNVLKIREATGFINFVEKDWVEAAIRRNKTRDPILTEELSDFNQNYETRILKTLELAYSPILKAWPKP